MKRLLYSLVFFLLVSLPVLAQNEGISFQGLARNAAGEVLVNQKISLRLSILLDSESGVVAYVETRQATTNPQGIFAVVLGDANTLTKSTDFSTINWTPAPKFIKVEMDPNAGTNFTAMGTSKLQAVPFAFYAYGVDAENVEGILPVGSGGTGVASIVDLKTSLGVDQVDNTADANKPLSAASQAALSTKANTTDVTTSLALKVDKVTGKGLSSNDFTTAEKTKLAEITGNVTGPTGPQGPIGLTGPAGVQGPIGPVGPAGSNGAVGAQGLHGEAGLPGEAGPRGLPGINGTNGIDGATGPQGPIGLTGPAGVQGPIGPVGPAGSDGAVGAQGLPGEAGPRGLPGINGTNGIDGVTGPQGIQGPTGATGAAGVDGKTVLNGTTNPTNQGVEGDFYINTATNMLFGPKANGVWPTGVSLVGPQGAQGSTGAAGTQGIPGPTGATGAVGPAPSGTGIVTVSSGTLQTPGGLTGDVTTSGAGLVTSIATGAVTSDKLLDGTIATADLANSAVTDEKIAGVAGSKVSGNITGNAANVTGTVAVGNGGTGATTLPANSVLVGNDTSAVQAVAPGTSGNVLTSNGTTWTSATPSGGGVPYTGATGAVNLGAYDLTVNEVKVGKGLANIADNTAVGINALNAASASGGGNSAFGYQALQANTTGYSNSAFGYKALTANTTGYYNTAIGRLSLQNNSIGYQNIGIGERALSLNSDGFHNIGIGGTTLESNRFGDMNIAIGHQAGMFLNNFNSNSGDGGGNVFIGFQAGIGRNRGNNNTALGKQSLYSFTVTQYNYSNATAVGIQSGFYNQNSDNTFLGSLADVDYSTNSSITNATAVGYQAKVAASNTIQLGADGTNSTTAITNVKTSGTLTAGTVTYPNTHGTSGQVLSTSGTGTLTWSTPSGGSGVAAVGTIGSSPNGNGASISGTILNLQPADATNGGVMTSGAQTFGGAKTFGSDIIVNGVAIGKGLNSVASNTRVGSEALKSNTTGSGNDAFGNASLRDNTTGTGNSAFGMGSLVSNSSGNYNIAMGNNAMMFNTTGGQNIAIGVETLVLNTSGNENTAMGFAAARANTTGSANTSIGWRAGGNVTTGLRNTFLGYSAGYTISTGTTANNTGLNSVMIGYDVRPLADGDNNEIVISGYNGSAGTVGLGSNTTLIGSSTTSTARIMGALNLPNTTASSSSTTGALTVGGGVGIAGGLNAGGTLTSGTVTYPNTHGSANQVLSTTGSGTLAWTTPSAGGGSGVPYTGATQAVDLGAYNLKVNGLSIGVGKANAQISNTAVGNAALGNNIDGINNVAIGYEALNGDLRGGNNVAVGWGALKMNIWGGSNIALGTGALGQNTNGISNVAIGHDAGTNNNGDFNTFIGKGASSRSSISSTTSNGNVYIGNNVGANGSGSYNIIIGATEFGSGSSQNFEGINDQIILATGQYAKQRVVFDGTNWLFKYDVLPSPPVHNTSLPNLGSTTVAWPKIYGGTVYASNNVLSSDLRLKSNISPLSGALSS